MPDPRSLLEVGMSGGGVYVWEGGVGMCRGSAVGICRGYVQRVRMGMYTHQPPPPDMGPGIPTCPDNDT